MTDSLRKLEFATKIGIYDQIPELFSEDLWYYFRQLCYFIVVYATIKQEAPP
jgi:hypothetical protein